MINTYLEFVAERHRVWERRQRGEPGPWTADPVLAAYKFTNVFRVLDYGSQFVLRELLNGEDRGAITYGDAVARAFLYRYTNRPEPWEFFHVMHGHYPLQRDLDSGLVLETWKQYRGREPYTDERGHRHGGGNPMFSNAFRTFPKDLKEQPIFGNAYKMFSGAENKGVDRLTWAVETARLYTGRESELSVVPAFARASTMADRLTILQTIPRCAGFMSMQIVTDMGYSGFVRGDEDEGVVAGPGALVGLAALGYDALYTPEEGIAAAQQLVHAMPDSPRLPLGSGRTRPPSLMDVQNTLCEFGKFVRYLKRDKLPGPYRPAHPGPQNITVPDHW